MLHGRSPNLPVHPHVVVEEPEHPDPVVDVLPVATLLHAGEQVVEALDFQKRKGGALGRILIDLGYIKEVDLNIALAAQKGYELVDLSGVNIPKETIESVPAPDADWYVATRTRRKPTAS